MGKFVRGWSGMGDATKDFWGLRTPRLRANPPDPVVLQLSRSPPPVSVGTRIHTPTHAHTRRHTRTHTRTSQAHTHAIGPMCKAVVVEIGREMMRGGRRRRNATVIRAG